VNSRPVTLLLAALVGALFLAGLLLDGVPGGLLLLVVAALLVALSLAAWATVPARGRAARIGVLALVLVLAGVKLAS
jgi:hypothetical protein